jgi:hypothetical protein
MQIICSIFMVVFLVFFTEEYFGVSLSVTLLHYGCCIRRLGLAVDLRSRCVGLGLGLPL